MHGPRNLQTVASLLLTVPILKVLTRFFLCPSAPAVLTVALMTLAGPAAVYGQSTESIEYFHTDAIGSVRMVTGPTGEVLERRDFLPFGEELSPPAGAQSLGFAGKERDTETANGSWMALSYLGARNLHVSSGRFYVADKVFSTAAVGSPQLWNKYAYAINNPLAYVDPDGRWPFYIHDAMYEIAFGRLLSRHDLDLLKRESRDADFENGAQSPEMSFTHSMCPPRTTVGQCGEMISGFINYNISEAKRASRGGENLNVFAIKSFGRAAHALTDMGSPSHTDNFMSPIYYYGGRMELVAHTFNELFPTTDWDRIGLSIRLLLAGFAQAFPGLVSEKDVQAWSDRVLENYIDYTYQWAADPTLNAAARACARGNPAACGN